MKDRKGFTLLELLAIIVILGVLVLVVLPMAQKALLDMHKTDFANVSKKLIEDARKSMSDGEVSEINGGICHLPEAGMTTTIRLITDEDNRAGYFLEPGHDKSSFGKKYLYGYLVIYNKGTVNQTNFDYYISLIDDGGNGIGVYPGDTSQGALKEEEISKDKVLTAVEDLEVSDKIYIDGKEIPTEYRCEIRQ